MHDLSGFGDVVHHLYVADTQCSSHRQHIPQDYEQGDDV